MNHQQNRQISQAQDNHYCFLSGEDSKFDELIRWDDESDDEKEDVMDEMDDEAMDFMNELEMGNENNENNSAIDQDNKTELSLADKSEISDMGHVIQRHDTSDNTSVAPS